METIKEVLMRRDKISSDEAEELIDAATEELSFLLDEGNLEEAVEICYEWFGLEPDYLIELINRVRLR